MLVVAAVVGLAGCTAQGTDHAASSSTPTPTVSSAPTTSSPPTAVVVRTVWLCRPGRAPNPCISDLSTTVVAPDGTRTVQREHAARRTAADCFYAYPTVSGEQQANADLRIQAAQRQVALVQAARFSEVCDVWAPMYRQRTLGDLFNLADGAPDSAANRAAFRSLRSGWQ